MELFVSFKRNNFMILQGLLFLTIIQNYAYVEAQLVTIVLCVCTLYIGSTRSLSKYQFTEKENKKNDKNQDENTAALSNENSLLSLKTALSIPLIATVTLLTAYFTII